MQPWKRRVIVLATMIAILGGAAFFFLRTRGLSPGYFELRIFSDDASGLMDGTQVRLDGIPIGYLETQKLTNSRDLMRKVELDLKIRVAYRSRIPMDSVAGLQSDNLLGDLYIAIHRGKSVGADPARRGVADHAGPGYRQMMARMSQQLERLRSIAERADKLSRRHGGPGFRRENRDDPNLAKGPTISRPDRRHPQRSAARPWHPRQALMSGFAQCSLPNPP